MRQIYILPLLMLTLTACTSAKQASEVTAAFVPATNYAGLTCSELQAAAERIRATTPAIEMAVQEAYKRDRMKEQVGWWLFAPALLFMEGNAEQQTQLALAKGQLQAIQTAAVTCKQPPNPPN